MENLQSLMRCLDDISKMIPEGTYLEMCDNLKNLHKDIKTRDRDPPVVDRRSIPHRTPFMPVMHDLEDIPVVEKIKEKEKQLKKLRIRKNITEVVKRDAVRKCAERLGFELRSDDIEELRTRWGVVIPDERQFYKEYIDTENFLTQGARNMLEGEIIELRDQVEELQIL